MALFDLRDSEMLEVRDILGYLNFSSGNYDPRFYKAWNSLFFALDKAGSQEIWSDAGIFLKEQLTTLSQKEGTFRHCEQAESVLSIVYEQFLPAYRDFHSDLLFHQKNEFLYNPFFLAQVCEKALLLKIGGLEGPHLVREMINRLNDLLGYRPIPVLEGAEKHEPNPHEWVAPLSLYKKDVGVAFGPYRILVEKTLEILRDTDPNLLHDACFDPDKLRELVLDPRAYDFEHPVNRRPNYIFGTWDPHQIDESGYYRRFVVHQLTLNGMSEREELALKEQGENPELKERLLFEAAAVLAGTILMGSGISGDHVQTYDSTVSLSTLMPLIANYRDEFYAQLIQKVPASMKGHLDREAARLFQPFGGVRQDLNKHLSKCRSDQLQRSQLARTYARMGYFVSAMFQTQIISVVAARLLCQIDCHITEAHLLADRKELKEATMHLPKIEDLLFRGIACGALPDPWTLLGFGGEYSLFISVDNTIHDHRLDDLISLLNDIFDLYSRLQKEAAVAGETDLQADLSDQMSSLAGWWDQFGSTEVSSVEGFSGQEAWESTAKVANALAVWHKAGTAAGDVAFWRRHVDRFTSPKAFVLLCESLLEQNDLVSSSALLIHWLSESDRIPLQEGDYTFHTVTMRWMNRLWKSLPVDSWSNRGMAPDPLCIDAWNTTVTFLDRLEANADKYWNIPTLELDPAYFAPEDETLPKKTESLIKKNPALIQVSICPMADNHVQMDFSEFWVDYLRNKFDSIEKLGTFIIDNFHKGIDCLDKDTLRGIFLHIRKKELKENRATLPEAKLIAFFDWWYDIVHKYHSLSTTDTSASGQSKDHHFPEELELLYQNTDAMSKLLNLIGENSSDDSKDIDVDKKIQSEIISMLRKSFTDEPHKKDPTDPSDEEVHPDEITFNQTSDLENKEDLAEGDSDFDDEDGFDEDDEDLLDELALAEILSDDEDDDSFDEMNEEDEEDEEDGEDEEDEETRKGINATYNAAYDNMSFRDSASDGVEDEMMDGVPSEGFHNGDDFDISQEMYRINERLSFTYAVIKLWRFAASKSLIFTEDDDNRKKARLHMESWLRQLYDYKRDLESLLSKVSRYIVPKPSGTAESLMEYDQHRGTKELLLDRVVWSIVEVTDTILFILSIFSSQESRLEKDPLSNKTQRFTWKKKRVQPMLDPSIGVQGKKKEENPLFKTNEKIGDQSLSLTVSCISEANQDQEDRVVPHSFASLFESEEHVFEENPFKEELQKYHYVLEVVGDMISGNIEGVKLKWKDLLHSLEKDSLLYIPTSRGGAPSAIVSCRCLQQVVIRLLKYAPRLCLFDETFALIRTIQKMERVRPSMPGAITEFDRLFETATRSIAQAIIESSSKWRITSSDKKFDTIEDALVFYIQRTTDILAGAWLSHSQHIRISSVESLMTSSQWEGTREFIIKYGADIFTQHFLGFRNLRAILHQGVESWLRSLIKLKNNGEDLEAADFLVQELLEKRIHMSQAVFYLELIFECIAENYSEYIDYNSTTTHSDHGEKTYMFLDMLRVLTSYERVSWNLKPVYWIHDTILRAKHLKAASLWEDSITRRSASIADENLKNYTRLSEQYGIWLPSIHERLQERLIRPLQIDRMCSLVSQAVQDARDKKSVSAAFVELDNRIKEFTQSPMGIGFELPEWLSSLQEEVFLYQAGTMESNGTQPPEEDLLNPTPIFPAAKISRSELYRQLKKWLQIDFKE